MNKTPPPRVQMLLRVWASKLERNLLDSNELEAILLFLRRLSAGETVDDIFGIWRPANRPKDHALEQRLYEMAIRRLPVCQGGEGLSYAETIEQTAKQYSKSVETIKADFKSVRGREVLSEVTAQGELAASLGFAVKWQGGKTQE